jgi:hypothetical protein
MGLVLAFFLGAAVGITFCIVKFDKSMADLID